MIAPGIRAALINLYGRVPDGAEQLTAEVKPAEDGEGFDFSIHQGGKVRIGWNAGSRWQASISCAFEIGKVLGLVKEAS